MKKHRIQRQKWLKCGAVCISLLLVFGLLLPHNMATVHAAGTDIDWSKIPSYTGQEAVTNWSVAKGDGGYYLNVTESWDYGVILIRDANGSAINGANSQLTFANGTVTNTWSQQINGATAQREQRDGKFCYEVFVPDSAFPEGGFQLACGNSVVKSADIPSAGGSTGGTDPTEPTDPDPTEPTDPTDPEPKPDPTEPTVPADYNGIVIDGSFDDWAAVPKTDVDEGKGYSNVDHVAMVWDGDYVYLYFDAVGTDQGWAVTGNWDSVCGGGPSNNGQYAITTDLGNQLLVQLKNDNGKPAVAGIDGATAAVNNTAWDKAPHCWEVRIPASALPKYKDTISFGFYQVEPLIKDVADLQGSSGGTFNGVVIDGKYEDWTYYPHKTIQHAGSGTPENVVDGRFAIYSGGETLYAHAETSMPAHLNSKGGDFLNGMSLKINDSLIFGPKFITADGAGNINWNPSLGGLADGDYTYYIVPINIGTTAKTLDELKANGDLCGKMIVTVNGETDHCEWEMDVETLSKRLRKDWNATEYESISPEDIKKFAVNWINIGNEWAETAGTSTGPLLGIMLCLGVCAVPVALISRKRRGQL